MRLSKKFIVSFGVVLIIATLTTTAWTTGIAFRTAHAHGWCGDIKISAQSAPTPAEAAYRLQEYNACRGASNGDSVASATPSAEAAATPTPTATAAATASATPTVAATATPAATATDAPQEHEVVFYATMGGKVGINAYGPQAAQDPSLGGILLEDMSAAQFLQEMAFRIQRDPMLTASVKTTVVDGGQLDNADAIDALVASYLADRTAWDQAIAEIEQKFDEAIAAGAQTQYFDAGYYTTTYAIPADDGSNAWVRTNASIWREGEAYVVLNGVAIRYGCGGQPYWANPTPVETTMPEPSSGMNRDAEGTPYVPTSDTPSGGGDGGGANPPPVPGTPDGNTPSGGGTTPPGGSVVPPADNTKPVSPNADGVVTPNQGETTVDNGASGQGSSEEPAADPNNQLTGSGSNDSTSSSDGNTSELDNQGGTEENAADPVDP